MRSLYDCLKTKRYHTRNVKPQTTGDHSAGMMLLLEMFHPSPTLNLYRAILFHDAHEKEFGDNPSNAKSKKFSKVEDKFAKQFAEKWQTPEINLTQEEELWLKLLDKMEVLYYIGQSAPALNQDEIEIFQHSSAIVNSLVAQLQTFGYFTEPDETIN